jgi:signal recognition particle receptor subunit beta
MGIFTKNKPSPLVGKRIVLDHMEDPEPIPDGATGTVVAVDDWGHIHVQWDNGRSLSVIPGEDRFEIKENEKVFE